MQESSKPFDTLESARDYAQLESGKPCSLPKNQLFVVQRCEKFVVTDHPMGNLRNTDGDVIVPEEKIIAEFRDGVEYFEPT